MSWPATCEHTLARNPSNAVSACATSLDLIIWQLISEPILVRSHLLAIVAVAVLLVLTNVVATWRSICVNNRSAKKKWRRLCNNNSQLAPSPWWMQLMPYSYKSKDDFSTRFPHVWQILLICLQFSLFNTCVWNHCFIFEFKLKDLDVGLAYDKPFFTNRYSRFFFVLLPFLFIDCLEQVTF